jgi:uncharacterized phiE125 gp8 family phage protein
MSYTTTTGPALRLVQAPNIEPVTRAMVKSMAAVDSDITDHDATVDLLIAASRQACEHETGRKLITQDWAIVLDDFPVAEIELPVSPIQSVVSITYIDAAGATQTLAGASYTLDNANDSQPFLLPAVGVTWPHTLDTAGAVTIRVRCGYGDTAETVPASARAWIAVRAAEQVPGSDVKMTEYVHRSIDGLRNWSV